MNAINAVLATSSSATTNSPTEGGTAAAATLRNGSAIGHHNTAATSGQDGSTSHEGYTQLGQGSSSSCSSSSESEDQQQRQQHNIGQRFSGSTSEESEENFRGTFPSDKTDCHPNRAYPKNDRCLSSDASSSSLNLSSANIDLVGQYSDDFDAQFLYSVQSLEHDLDCILENRDLNPFYDDPTGGVSSDAGERMSPMGDEDHEEACEFNVEDYLVDLDQYLEEQDQKSVNIPSDASSSHT